MAAFVAGLVAGDRRAGALAGGVAVVFGTSVYYAIFHWFEGGVGLLYAAAATVGWSLAGLVAGGLFGFAGGLWREGGRPRALAAGLLGGGLMAESALLWGIWDAPTAQRVVVAQAAVGALLAVVLTPRARLAPLTAAVAVGAGTALLVGELVVRELLRTSGWAGA